MNKTISRVSRSVLLAGALVAAAIPAAVRATPYASGCTNSGGTITFYLNESGGNVTVRYEDGSTNANFNGINTGTNLAKGPQSFAMSSHTGYAIQVYKAGNGTPSQISSDTFSNSVWGAPRGVAVNKNPKNDRTFGRIYAGSDAAGGTVGTTYKGLGLYSFNADESDAIGIGTNAVGSHLWGSTTSEASFLGTGPWKMSVAPDSSVFVEDCTVPKAAVYQFNSDLTSSNLALGYIGQANGVSNFVHGAWFGTPIVTGSLAQSNMVLWMADSEMATPNGLQDPGLVFGPGTGVGYYNNIYRYDIGAGPLPWTNAPNYAYNVGLPGIQGLNPEIAIGKDGKIIAGFDRANLSNPNVQILDPTGSTVLWTSWVDSQGNFDPWRGEVNNLPVGLYCGLRVSADGLYLASVDVDNSITIGVLTNGIPDDSTLFGILNNSNTGNSRGMDWDAADNIYVISSGQALLRIWSLGLTTVCITSNDITGTNGTFQLILPPVTASVVATQPVASQNYVNNSVNAGTPIPGDVRFTLSTNILATPLVLNYAISGSGTLGVNYTLNYGTNANGIYIGTNIIVFPVTNATSNLSADILVTPTKTPVSGPSLTVGFTVLGGAQNVAGTPTKATISIQNTGPQLIFLTNNASAFGGGVGNTMSRSIPGDYAKFRIIRWGDTNGPGNNALSINPVSYTITNFIYSGTAVFPTDYTAQSQRGDPTGNGTLQSPTAGSPGVVINPGDVTVIAVDGLPVPHANLNVAPVNVTINISDTNTVFPYTNCTTLEGYSYTVAGVTNNLGIPTNVVSITEFDNAIGGELVLWSDPLTNSMDSTNWTLTFAATNFAAFPVLPVVIHNYTNDETAFITGGTNDFRVEFGNPIANDSVPQSAAMAVNGWNTALRMTVHKDGGQNVCGVNVFPQGLNFLGNYALRYSMYLSLYGGAVDNPSIGTIPFEYALCAVNTTGTNCDWRTQASVGPSPAFAAPTNSDGIWFAWDAGYGGITPADYDAFDPASLPNSGVINDLTSSTALSENGVFKSPPFESEIFGNSGGGEPVNQWVDVSVEITLHTNVNVFFDRAQVLPSFSLFAGSTNYTQGVPMLGYLDPIPDVGDNGSQYVYYSNIRIVELSPDILSYPVSVIVTNGANVSFSSSTAYGTAPVTNSWYLNSTATAATLAQVNTANATNISSTLALNNVQFGTNILVVASDLAGSENGFLASLEVITAPTNRTVSAGTNFVAFVAIPTGPSAPTAFQWFANGVPLANNSHYAGVTTGTLTITNAQLSDAVTYTVTVTNAAGSVVESASLVVNALQPSFTTASILGGTNAVLSFTTADPFDNTGSFTLQSSTQVNGPFTNTAGATITGSAGAFQFKAPFAITNKALFYRLMHN